MKLTVRVEGSLDIINGHVAVTKAYLHVGGHQLGFDLERDVFRQVDLHKTQIPLRLSAQICEWK